MSTVGLFRRGLTDLNLNWSGQLSVESERNLMLGLMIMSTGASILGGMTQDAS
jgi:hypothetical protein